MLDDIATLRSYCLANTDFFRPLRDRHEEDIHDADASDKEGDRSNPSEEELQCARDGREGLEGICLTRDSEGRFIRICDLESSEEGCIDCIFRGSHQVFTRDLDRYRREVLGSEDTELCRREGDIDCIIWILPADTTSLRLGDADDTEEDIPDTEGLPEWILRSEEIGHDRRAENRDLIPTRIGLIGDKYSRGDRCIVHLLIGGSDSIDRDTRVIAPIDDLLRARDDR